MRGRAQFQFAAAAHPKNCEEIAARSMQTARAQAVRLEAERRKLAEARIELAKEKLSLDIADKKLAAEEQKAQRLAASRAADHA